MADETTSDLRPPEGLSAREYAAYRLGLLNCFRALVPGDDVEPEVLVMRRALDAERKARREELSQPQLDLEQALEHADDVLREEASLPRTCSRIVCPPTSGCPLCW